MWFGLFLLLTVAILLVFLVWRDRRLSQEYQTMLREYNFRPRESSPIPTPFVYERLDRLVCFDGDLRPGTPITLLLGTRYTGGGKQRMPYYYIGIYFPPRGQLSDPWLNRWKNIVAERGDDWAVHSGAEKTEKNWGPMGPPQSLPIRAMRLSDGGVILAWNGLHLRKNIEARIAEVTESLEFTQGEASPQLQPSATEKYLGEAKPGFVDWRDAMDHTIRQFANGKWADWQSMSEAWGNKPHTLYPWNDPIHQEGMTVIQMNLPTMITYWASIEWQNSRMVLHEQHEKEGTIADYVSIDIPEPWLNAMKDVLWPPPRNGYWYM